MNKILNPSEERNDSIWISIDLEMNNDPTESEDNKEVEKLVISDIIQIGAVAFNCNTGEIIELFNCYIKLPMINEKKQNFEVISNNSKKIHPKIIKLTGITEEILNSQGTSLYLGYKLLENFVKKHKAFRDPLSWGGNDALYLLNELKEKCNFKEKYVFGSNYFDAKKFFQSYCLINNMSMKSGLGKSMKRVGLVFSGRQHNALDDSLNTATIFHWLICKLKNKLQ